jgi:hypothetical protein
MTMEEPRRDADFTVEVGYDEDAEVWVIKRSDVPGLTVEGDTYDQLIGKIHTLTPMLLAANDVQTAGDEVAIDIRYRDLVRVG